MAKRDNALGVYDAAATGHDTEQSGKTTITLSITEADKLKVKVYAMAHKTTVSDLLHGWIQEHCSE